MNGIIIINKQKGVTSNYVVNQVKHILNCKVGHTGTLDPNATGVLPLLLGDGTKFSKYLINHDKKYCATLQLGTKMSTADVEGDVVEQKAVRSDIFEEGYINDILASFIGVQIQTPPVYSAIKINGKKLYEYARKGIDVDVPKRKIEIYKMELVDFDSVKKRIRFNVECSKGTYIRSLCEDIAEKMNTVGYMFNLDRLKVGDFCIENSVSTDMLQDHKGDKIWLNEHIITLEDVMVDNSRIDISKSVLERFLNGVRIETDKSDGVYKIYCDNDFIGSGIAENSRLKRDIVLNKQ